MITLKTLALSHAQDVFNQVKTHLLTQMEQSRSSGGACRYRGPRGLKCAAGCLIADDEYHLEMEDMIWDALVRDDTVPGAHVDLVGSLQSVHDGTPPAMWEASLALVADSFGLQP